MSQLVPTIDDADRAVLARARERLEHPSLAARLSSAAGTPIEIAIKLLPPSWYRRLHGVAEAAVEKALGVAVSSLRVRGRPPAHPGQYRLLGGATGALGGAFGLPALALELPVTTTLMLQAIADIARSEGEDLADLEARLACLEVFALGGRSEADDAAETGYYGVRLALALPVSSAARHVASHGLGADGPALVGLIHGVSSRFGVTLSQRAAARLVPVVGALGGAAVNVIFVHHFQEMARGHFALRRLERKYGQETVRAAYADLGTAEGGGAAP